MLQHFRHFIPSRFSRSGRCPSCDAVDRHRLMWLYLQNCTNILNTRLRILHFSPEFSIYQKLRAYPNLNYTTADFDPHAPLTMVRMDITQIPYAENTIDVILCSHVLSNVPDDRKAINALYRILKPGGWALLLVPLDLERDETFEAPNEVNPRSDTASLAFPSMSGSMAVTSRIVWRVQALQLIRYPTYAI